MTRRIMLPMLLGAVLLAAPAHAQVGGGAGGAGGVGGGVGAGGAGAGGIGIGGGAGTGSSLPSPDAGGVGTSGTGVSPSTSPGLGSGSTAPGTGIGLGSGSNGIGGGAGAAAGAGTSTTEERASEGSTSINPLNVDSIARDGDVGAATSLSGAGTAGGVSVGTNLSPSVAGAGPEGLYNIPRASVAVDLQAIRGALAAGPSATPKPDGR